MWLVLESINCPDSTNVYNLEFSIFLSIYLWAMVPFMMGLMISVMVFWTEVDVWMWCSLSVQWYFCILTDCPFKLACLDYNESDWLMYFWAVMECFWGFYCKPVSCFLWESATEEWTKNSSILYTYIWGSFWEFQGFDGPTLDYIV